MVGTLSPRGKEEARMKIRFIRYEEAPKYFGMDSELIIAYAKAAGAVYQLAKIRLIYRNKVEIFGRFVWECMIIRLSFTKLIYM